MTAYMDQCTRVYTRTGHATHLLRPEHSPGNCGEALCGLTPDQASGWFGTGTQAETDRAASLQLCSLCAASAVFGSGQCTTCTTCGSPVLALGMPACTRHLKEALGLSYRQLDYAVRVGHLRPIRTFEGPGSPRWWPSGEVEIARRIGRLTTAGIPLPFAAGFARNSWPRGEIAPGIVIEVTR